MYKCLEKIAEDYVIEDIDFVKRVTLEEEKTFYKKYINTDVKSDIEDDFNTVIVKVVTKSFIDGFKACIAFLNECITPQESANKHSNNNL